MHKPKTGKSLSMNTDQLSNEIKSQGSVEVNTPQKKDPVQESKVFEAMGGL